MLSPDGQPAAFTRSDDGIRMSGFGTKRRFSRCKAMSGVGSKADLPVERPDFSL
jgi:hypothetical protein